jgi:hypothetical protein
LTRRCPSQLAEQGMFHICCASIKLARKPRPFSPCMTCSKVYKLCTVRRTASSLDSQARRSMRPAVQQPRPQGRGKLHGPDIIRLSAACQSFFQHKIGADRTIHSWRPGRFVRTHDAVVLRAFQISCGQALRQLSLSARALTKGWGPLLIRLHCIAWHRLAPLPLTSPFHTSFVYATHQPASHPVPLVSIICRAFSFRVAVPPPRPSLSLSPNSPHLTSPHLTSSLILPPSPRFRC